jgi:hypothetical protein
MSLESCIGSSRPNVGEGLGVRRILHGWINSQNSALDEGLKMLARIPDCLVIECFERRSVSSLYSIILK